jgi:hypothetical protein
MRRSPFTQSALKYHSPVCACGILVTQRPRSFFHPLISRPPEMTAFFPGWPV